MSIQGDDSLYSKLHEMILKGDFGYQVIPGLDSELKMLLDTDGIKGFTMKEEENCYKIKIIMNDYDKRKAHDFFLKIFRLISYGASGLFVSKEMDRGVRYLFASFIRRDFGFLCEIDIVPMAYYDISGEFIKEEFISK